MQNFAAENKLYHEDFKDEINSILSKSVAIGAILAGTLVPAFSILDYIFKPHYFILFLFIRIFVSMCAWTVYALISMDSSKSYALGAFLTIVVGGSVAVMCRLDMGPADPYYAGINLPILGFGVLLPLTIKQSFFPNMVVWLIYFIPNLLILEDKDLTIFISNNFFVLSSIVISISSSKFHLKQRKKQWQTNLSLATAHKKIESYAKDMEQEAKKMTKQALQSEKLAVVGQLAGGIAHDFNNILTAILGTSEILMSSLHKDDPVKKDIETIYKAGLKAVELVKQLLAFSKNQVIQPRNIDINQVISKLKKMLSRIIGEDIELVVKCGSGLKTVQVDPVQIEQVIFNLAVNARDAMPDGGKLTIETSNIKLNNITKSYLNTSLPDGNYVMITTSDNGTGMTEEVRNRIFEPFFTTKETAGTGLGLSTVYGIIQQSGGDILCETKINKGTTFKILLPSLENIKPEDIEKKSNKISTLTGFETILIVEDEDEVRKLTARILQKHGYTVLEADRPTKALAILDQFNGKIDLVFTDIVMPEMNGKVLVDKILKKFPGIKVLYTSGYINNTVIKYIDDKLKASFIKKPYTMERLTEKIRQVLNN